MAVITISRQSGSEGNWIVKLLCNRLGYSYFDKNLMAKIAAEEGLDPSEIEDITAEDHHVKSFWEQALTRMQLPNDPNMWMLGMPYETKQALTVQQVEEYIHAAYQKGDVIIVGRGSQIILANKPDVLHVRIVTPLEQRIQRWMKREGVSHEEAQKIVKQRDKKHVDFIKTYFDEDINNPELYDLVINTGKLSLEIATDLIIEAAESLQK